jgi:sulfite reductase (NADPH) hemoprotein beta-component
VRRAIDLDDLAEFLFHLVDVFPAFGLHQDLDARLPDVVAAAVLVVDADARFQDLDEEWDIGEIDINFSGCINSCGHHHAGHIGILGVDKDGKEWYQITLGGGDGSHAGGPAAPGKIVGPSFAKEEVAGVIEALIDAYRQLRQPSAGGKLETFVTTLRRVGHEPFKAAANGARFVEREVA